MARALTSWLAMLFGRSPAWPLAGLLSVWMGRSSPAFAALALALIAALLLWKNWQLQRALDRLSRQWPGTNRLADVDHRLISAHPVSGLPMREGLLARINADGSGFLGAIAFVDFARLTAFDPAMGERVFALLSARLRKMIPATRFVAQVDRGHVGIWFDQSVGEASARAELSAITYALSDAIVDSGRDIVPQVQFRLAPFTAEGGLSAGAFLARTLASFALAPDAFAADSNKTDPTELARDRYALEQDLRQAIARRELVLDFQPLVDAAQRRVCGAEALLRWHHPERGLISPVRFVPVMEAIGLASEIGSWVLNAAVREAREWQAQGLKGLRIAVNVSGLQLERDDLPILVERTLQRHALSAAGLEIELTESVATSDTDHRRGIFERLSEMGVKLAVDDFGTGYSGFSSLRALRFDKIKIDREFVTDVDTRADSQAICQSIIALARGLGIEVLAEGVERHAEYAWFRRHGCHYFQGYYFSRPLDTERFATFVRDRRALNLLLSLGGERHDIIERLRA